MVTSDAFPAGNPATSMLPSTTTRKKSIWTRKLDLLYLIFFVIHVPVMLSVDLAPYYPIRLRPKYTVTLREFYINTYRDRFFTQPPAWFHAYMVLEVFYHVPVSLWAVGALVRDDLMVPLQLLVFAMETGVTTLTCVVEMLSWEGYSGEEQARLAGLYVPYLALALLMGVDMFVRLRKVVLGATLNGIDKKIR